MKKLTFVMCASESFMDRANIALESIKKHHPKANIIFEKFEQKDKSNSSYYLPGFARRRLELVKEQVDKCIYGDLIVMVGADCVFYDNYFAGHLSEDIFDASIVLCPHVIKPPKDNVKQLYRTGHANADFVIFNRHSKEVLTWLLEQDLDDDLKNGSFFEQTYLSALPFLFDDVVILRDNAEINFAYFNAHERTLTKNEKGDYLVDGAPLIMVQFSGFIDNAPERLSKHYSGVSAKGPLLELFSEYNQKVNK